MRYVGNHELQLSDRNMSEQGLAGRGVPDGHHANRGRDANRRNFSSLPNILTYARIVAVPALVACFFVEADWGRWLAMWIFIAAGVSDFLDGYLARAWQQQSALGQMLDPIADKLIVAAALLMLAANGTIAGWSLWAGVIILSREILVSGLREFLGSLSVSVPVSNLAKWKTVVQMVAIGFLLAGPAGDKVWPYTTNFGLTLLWIAAILTLYTGYDYLRATLRHLMPGDK
ncbi:MAG: CDP-diacylglycerol--glycerol-3-phosphate 3-phosphatidyltransferase [Methyloceanibacter sp.]